MAKRVWGRFGEECGCDDCQVVYRTCMLCTAPKRPSAYPLDLECNLSLNEAAGAERERLMAAIVRRMQARACRDTGRTVAA